MASAAVVAADLATLPCRSSEAAVRGARSLVVRLDNAGDVLLAGPAVRAAGRDRAGVTLLCGPRGRDAAELLPGVDEVIVYDAPWIRRSAPVDRRGVGLVARSMP